MERKTVLVFLAVCVGSLFKGQDGKGGCFWRTPEDLSKFAVYRIGYFHPSLLCLALFLSLCFAGLLQFLHRLAMCVHVTTWCCGELLVQGCLFVFAAGWVFGFEDSLTSLRLTLGPSREDTFWQPCSTPPGPMTAGFTVAPSFALQIHKMGSFRRPRPRFMSSPVLSDLPRFQAARQALQLSSNSAWNRWAGPTWAELPPCSSPVIRAVRVWSLLAKFVYGWAHPFITWTNFWHAQALLALKASMEVKKLDLVVFSLVFGQCCSEVLSWSKPELPFVNSCIF